MTITLSDGITTLELDEDLLWSDQHTWSPVEQTVTTSITGAIIVDVGVRLAGRPITLQAGDSYGWITYATVTQLRAWAAVPDKQLTLTLRGTAFDVIFRHHEAPAVDVRPLIEFNEPEPDDQFIGTLKFTEV